MAEGKQTDQREFEKCQHELDEMQWKGTGYPVPADSGEKEHEG